MKKVLLALLAIVVAGVVLPFTVDLNGLYEKVFLGQQPEEHVEDEVVDTGDDESDTEILELKEMARKNLNLVVKPVELQDYWRKVSVPGMVVDRPGFTDVGVTAPTTGVVSEVLAFEGDIVRPGDPLFTLRLIGQTIQKVQMDYHKTVLEIGIIDRELKRVENLAKGGIVPGKRIIELKQNRQRQAAILESLKQNLFAFGLIDTHLNSIRDGNFVKQIQVVAPDSKTQSSSESTDVEQKPVFYEVQDLKVEMGSQVKAGDIMTVLGNHRKLFVKGHVFEHEAGIVKRATLNGWPLQIHFVEAEKSDWPEVKQQFTLRHLSSVIDPESRTFDFFIKLENQAKTYTKDEKGFVFWRFRPGQRVRIELPVEKLEKVMVVPNDAIHRDGVGSYVFQQNGDLFLRHSVRVLHRDRTHTVIAQGGMMKPGYFIAQNSAASLNRILNSQKESGAMPGMHVHADGTVHAAH